MLTLNEQMELVAEQLCEYLGCERDDLNMGSKRGKPGQIHARRVFVLVCVKLSINDHSLAKFTQAKYNILNYHKHKAQDYYRIYGDMKKDTDMVLRRVSDACGGWMVV